MQVLPNVSVAYVPPANRPAQPRPAASIALAGLPGLDLPPIPPQHPALPSPPPSLEELLRLAARAPDAQRFVPGSHPSTIRNAHYANTRSQLAFALAGPYNSVEGDIRMRDGHAVMQHDSDGRADLTFEQWALIAHRAGKHLRIDIKEPRALDEVTSTLERLGIPSGAVTFNVGIHTPVSNGLPVESIRALRSRFPAAWITLNLPLPLGPGYVLASRVARVVGGDRLGVAVLAGLVHRGDVAMLRRSFSVVNAWNTPSDLDVAATTAKLRSIGVNGMIDLRRKDDPLASDD